MKIFTRSALGAAIFAALLAGSAAEAASTGPKSVLGSRNAGHSAQAAGGSRSTVSAQRNVRATKGLRPNVLVQGTSPTITQSTNTTTLETGYGQDAKASFLMRRFFLNADSGITDPFTVSNVQWYEVGFAGEVANYDVQLYSIPHGADFTFENMTLIGSASGVANFDTDPGLQSAPGHTGVFHFAPEITAVSGTIADPTTTDLVVALHHPDQSQDPGAPRMYFGTNSLGETQPTYYADTDPGSNEPATMTSFGINDGDLMMTLNAPPPPPCTAAPVGLVGWYKGGGNATDSSGNGSDGTVSGNITYGQAEVGLGFVFDGSTSTAEYVSVPASTTLDPGSSGSGFSIDAWINPADIGSGYHTIAEWNNGSAYGVHLYMNNGDLYANVVDSSGLNHPLTAAAVLSAGSFQHVALSYDKTSGMAYLYLNGTAVANANLGTLTPQTSYPLYLGARASASGLGLGNTDGPYTFNGTIDELHIYNRALTADEIAGIDTAAAGGQCPVQNPKLDKLGSVTNADTGTVQTSNTITISGLTAPAEVLLTGDSSAVYKISSGGYGTSPGTVNNGDTLTVQLTPTSYSSTIQATLMVGQASASYSVSTHEAPPPTPTILSATPGTGTVALTWSASTGAQHYNVYMGTTAGGESSTPTVFNAFGTSANVTGLSANKTYYFKVGAVRNGVVAKSAEASATTSPPPPPVVNSAIPDVTQVTLNWSASSGAQHYNIYVGTTPGGESTNPTVVNLYGTSATVTGLISGKAYYFKVAAISNGAVILSAEANATTLAPAAPSITATVPTSNQVTLNWTASTGAQHYNVYMGTTAGGEATTPTVFNAFGTSATVTGLSASKTYYFKVGAVSNGVVTLSAEASATTSPPAPPSITSATPGTNQVTLNWTASAGAQHYHVYMGTTSGGESGTPTVFNVFGTTATVTGLTQGKTYYFVVGAVSNGTVNKSSEASATSN